MVWLAVILLVSIVIALFRGGRLTNLSDIQLRFWWLLPVGFAMQAAANFLPEDEGWSRGIGVGLVLTSYLPLLLVVVINRHRQGMWLTGAGVLMNFTVIAINGGMPVLTEAAQVAGGFSADVAIVRDYKHVLLDSTTRMAFLADVIPVRLFGQGQVISLGDVFLAVGLGRFLETEMRKPIRWFKHGVPASSGSATKTYVAPN